MAQIIDENGEIHPSERSAPPHSTADSAGVSAVGVSAEPPLPSCRGERQAARPAAGSHRARPGYVAAASSTNTRKAYASDWKHFTAWCRRQNFSPLPPDPQVVSLYITACASGSAVGTPTRGGKLNSVSTIERRLAAIGWNYAQRGTQKLDRRDRAITTVMAGIRNKHAAPPRQKEAILPEDLIAMLETLDRGSLRGLHDRAMLLLGFASGLRRSEITGLDLGRDQTGDARLDRDIRQGRADEIARQDGLTRGGDRPGIVRLTCPVAALEACIRFARLAKGPLFRPRHRQGQGGRAKAPQRLGGGTPRQEDDAGGRRAARSFRAEARPEIFPAFAVRALASSAEVGERHVQKQLGHASAEITRRY